MRVARLILRHMKSVRSATQAWNARIASMLRKANGSLPALTLSGPSGALRIFILRGPVSGESSIASRRQPVAAERSGRWGEVLSPPRFGRCLRSSPGEVSTDTSANERTSATLNCRTNSRQVLFGQCVTRHSKTNMSIGQHGGCNAILLERSTHGCLGRL